MATNRNLSVETCVFHVNVGDSSFLLLLLSEWNVRWEPKFRFHVFFPRSYENIFCQKVRATMKNSRQRILMKCYFIDVNTQCEMNNTTHRRLYIRLQSLLSLTMPKSYSSFLHTLQCVIYVLNMNIAEHEHATQHRTCSAFCYFVSAHNLTHLRLHRSYFKFS